MKNATLNFLQRKNVPLSAEERTQVRTLVTQVQDVIAPMWPIKTFAYYNPLRGLEHLPFDQAIQRGKDLLGGKGYLGNDEYRRMYREGRITDKAVRMALQRVGPKESTAAVMQVGKITVAATEVWRWHILVGFDRLSPVLWSWTLNHENPMARFRSDLPSDSQQRIKDQTLRQCETCKDDPEGAYLSNLWRAITTLLRTDETVFPDHRPSKVHFAFLPPHHTLSEWVDQLTDSSLVEQINGQMIKWMAAYLDEGLAHWEMPERKRGFYSAWRNLAIHDAAGGLLGIPDCIEKVQCLPDHPEDAIVAACQGLGIPQEQWKNFLGRHLSSLSGWAGFIRWRGENPHYPFQERFPVDPTQYLAVRLFYEKELVEVECRRAWNIPGAVTDIGRYLESEPSHQQNTLGSELHHSDPEQEVWCHDGWRLFHLAQFFELDPLDVQELSKADADRWLRWLDAFPPQAHGAVWIEAYEEGFREDVVERLKVHRGKVSPLGTRPRAQMIFCIDARSESFRRHFEAQGPYETFGYAGFFGIPMSYTAFDSHDHLALCPILLSPKHEVGEAPRSGERETLQSYLSGTRWQQLWHHLFHDLKYNPISSFMLVDVLGFLFTLGLAGKTLLRTWYDRIKAAFLQWWRHPVGTRVLVNPIPVRESEGSEEKQSHFRFVKGFKVEEQAAFIEGGLRVIGLTRDFGRFIVACGHGSRTDNNPYFAAYDCGACGGSHGDPNARAFASMGNNPEVRRILRDHGLVIPEDTWFLAAKHNTTTDRVSFYDVEDIPPGHLEDLHQLVYDLSRAGEDQALERCTRIPQAPTNISPKQAFAHVDARSMDWANSRPEWGLSSNAAFLIGRRQLTKGLDLKGRVFLHSYDPEPDAEGELLEKIMTAPLVVGELISLTYYFSAVDPWVYGSGSKVIHNVVSGVGVMLGSQSDLQRGLPLQSVNDGMIHYHEPMRLLAMIEAPCDRIDKIIHQHALLQNLFNNQWMNLMAIDPETGESHRYGHRGAWERFPTSVGKIHALRERW